MGIPAQRWPKSYGSLGKVTYSDRCSRHEITAKGRGQGYGLWAAYLTGPYTASLVLGPSQSTSLGKNKMFFVNKSSCNSIMKSFSSTVVKDTLSSPLGEDGQRKRSGQRTSIEDSHRLSLEKKRRNAAGS